MPLQNNSIFCIYKSTNAFHSSIRSEYGEDYFVPLCRVIAKSASEASNLALEKRPDLFDDKRLDDWQREDIFRGFFEYTVGQAYSPRYYPKNKIAYSYIYSCEMQYHILFDCKWYQKINWDVTIFSRWFWVPLIK